jgi:hypothetical protein
VWKKDFNWHKKRKGKKPTPNPSLKGREMKVESEELKVESEELKVENKK